MGFSGFNDNRIGHGNLDDSGTTFDKYFEEFARCHEWDQIVIRNFLRDESGNVESAMVLIPLIFLFLCCLQIISAIYVRNSEQTEVQSQASTRAISGTYLSTDSIINIPSSNRFEDQQILIVSKSREVPVLIPGLGKFLGRKLQSNVTGVAVIERPR